MDRTSALSWNATTRNLRISLCLTTSRLLLADQPWFCPTACRLPQSRQKLPHGEWVRTGGPSTSYLKVDSRLEHHSSMT